MDAQQSSLSLFQPPAIEKTIEKEEWVEFRPIGQISQGSVIQFNISSDSTNYIDLKKSRLHLKAQIQQPDGKPVTDKDLVGLVNLSLHALFRQVDVMLQQKVISPEIGVNYPYKALLDVLLHTGHDVKESRLQGELFFKDSSGSMDATDPITGGNGGLLERYALTSDGEVVSMEGPIHVDICQQEQSLLNGVQVMVKLIPSSEAFTLMAKNDVKYRVIITDAALKVCYVKVNPSVILAHNEALKEGEAIYPISQSDVKSFGIPQGSFTYTADGIFNGEVPSQLVVALVSSEAYAGSYKKNYGNFGNFDVNYLEFSVNGNAVPMQAFQPNYKKGEFTTEFLSLFYNKYPQGTGNFISREDYPEGYCIYVFNLTGTEGDLVAAAKKGHSRLTVKFGTALAKPVTLVAYARFPRVVKIDQARNVILP